MTQTIRVPDPVYSRIQDESDNKDIPVGIVVKEWMEAADDLARLRESKSATVDPTDASPEPEPESEAAEQSTADPQHRLTLGQVSRNTLDRVLEIQAAYARYKSDIEDTPSVFLLGLDTGTVEVDFDEIENDDEFVEIIKAISTADPDNLETITSHHAVTLQEDDR